MLLLNLKIVLSAMLNVLPPALAANVGSAGACSFQVMDAIDTHIDVSAQKHIMRALGSGDASAATQGLGVLAAVKSGALAGVFEPARGPVIERGKRMSPDNPVPWWTMIPKGELATCLTEPANEAPMLLYKSNLQPAQVTAALAEAWPQCGLPFESACFDEAIQLASVNNKLPLPAQIWRGVTTHIAAGHLAALIDAHDAKRTPPSSATAVERWIGIKAGDPKWRSALVTLKGRMEANRDQLAVTVKMPPESNSWAGCKPGIYAEHHSGTIYVCKTATKSDVCLQNVLTHEYFHSIGMPAEGTRGVERGGVCSPPGNLDAAMRTSSCLAGLACELTWGQGKDCSFPC